MIISPSFICLAPYNLVVMIGYCDGPESNHKKDTGNVLNLFCLAQSSKHKDIQFLMTVSQNSEVETN